MPTFLITYDLRTPGQNHAKVLAYIRRYQSHKMLSESCYAVSSRRTAVSIRNDLSEFFDRNDSVYVIELASTWASIGQDDVNDWLESHLG